MAGAAMRSSIAICVTACSAGSLIAAQPAEVVEAELVDPAAATDSQGVPVAPPAITIADVPDPDRDGERFTITRFNVSFADEHPQVPTIDALLASATVRLTPTPQGFVLWEEGLPAEVYTLAELSDGQPRQYYNSAIVGVANALRIEMQRRRIVGVFVAPEPERGISLQDGGQDFRDPGDTSVSLLVFVSTVSEVRTQAFGTRIKREDRINANKHRRIIRDSPIQPWSGEDDADASAAERSDLLIRDDLDTYAFLLSRHPGRRVDVSVGPSAERGKVVLDYLVQESKPWQLYAQVSNTGTEQTNEWRERFGVVHNQFTGRDDTFVLEYVTAGFDESHAIIANYETPLFRGRRLRLGINGSWSQYDASDVGASNQSFSGESWGAGMNLYYNFFQRNTLFVDAFAGFQYDDVEVNNDTFNTSGQAELFTPRIGLRAERIKETSTILGELAVRALLPDVTSIDSTDLEQLGRLNPDDDFLVMTWDSTLSFYLEPLFNKRGWEDPSTWRSSTLAHELEFRFRGQSAFNNRLVPNYQTVAGGLYSVRGYPESSAAGDTSYVGTVEYRFHWPRTFRPGDPDPDRKLFGRTFKVRPQQVYGRPDWDLVFRAFFDYAILKNSARASFETDETLAGTGVGVEFLLLRNLSVRLDYGIVLNEIGSAANGNLVEEGDTRLHFSLTTLF